MVTRTAVGISAVALVTFVVGCGATSHRQGTEPEPNRFTSAPPPERPAPPPSRDGDHTPLPVTRGLKTPDLWRVEGDRLYHLDRDRGLMVFDVSDIEDVRLLGSSPLWGDPADLIVNGGIVTAVMSSWFGVQMDGTPFAGAIVRNLDANDPEHIQVTAEVPLDGPVAGTHVSGSVLYTFSDLKSALRVTSVSMAGPELSRVDEYDVQRSAAIISASSSAIVVAYEPSADAQVPNGSNAETLELRYLDISDPQGLLVERGSVSVHGSLESPNGWAGPGRLDFSAEQLAHLISYPGAADSMSISTIDFRDPDRPSIVGSFAAPLAFGAMVSRFDENRLYLATSGGCSTSGPDPVVSAQTQLDLYDLSDPSVMNRASTRTLDLEVSRLEPHGTRLFAFGQTRDCQGEDAQSSTEVVYLDTADLAKPVSLGTASWGPSSADNWAGLTLNDEQGLFAAPWGQRDPMAGPSSGHGLQLLAFTDAGIAGLGVADTRAIVDHALFVKGRVLALSDLALAVVDYSEPMLPVVSSESLFGRNVKDVAPTSANVAEVSEVRVNGVAPSSELRLLPNVESELSRDAAFASIALEGNGEGVLRNGELIYVISQQFDPVPCPPDVSGGCFEKVVQVQALDSSSGELELRGKALLPAVPDPLRRSLSFSSPGVDAYDWPQGAGAVLAGNRLVLQSSSLDPPGEKSADVFVVDVSNPDELGVSSLTIRGEAGAWWGNLRRIGDDVYASHYEWVTQPSADGSEPGEVRFFLDHLDLSDATQPRVSQRLNVPGLLVGSAADDASLLYLMDYQFDGKSTKGDLTVVKVDGDDVAVQGHVPIPGISGQVVVKGGVAYLSVVPSDDPAAAASVVQIDLADPRQPVLLPSAIDTGGWLKAIEGGRAFVTSGWQGPTWAARGIDVFNLESGQAPIYEEFIEVPVSSRFVAEGARTFVAGAQHGTRTISR